MLEVIGLNNVDDAHYVLSAVRPPVWHTGDSVIRLKLGLCNFHRTVATTIQFLRGCFIQKSDELH